MSYTATVCVVRTQTVLSKPPDDGGDGGNTGSGKTVLVLVPNESSQREPGAASCVEMDFLIDSIVEYEVNLH